MIQDPQAVRMIQEIIDLTANSIAIVVAIITATIALLRRSRRFQEAVLGAPLRRAQRHVMSGMAHLARDLGQATISRLLDAQRKAQVAVAIEESDEPPGVLVAETLAIAGSTRQSGQIISWVTWSRLLHAYYRRARSTESSSLLARILYPDEARRLHSQLAAAEDHIGRFERCAIVTGRPGGNTPFIRGSFPAFVTALSGAVVLVDAAASRSRHAERVLIWHSRRYRSVRYRSDDGGGSYFDEHVSGECEAWRPAERLPGDFDQRVLALRSASLVEANTEGYLAFVIETSETCYATTECGDDIGCKHVDPSWRRDRFDRVLAPAAPQTAATVVGGATDGRVILVTAYVALATSDQRLLLAQRSGLVRHGENSLSATAGGVIQPGGTALVGDIDGFGAPDALSNIRRETKEETGLVISDEACRPVAVFLANVRGRTEGTRNDGQLVAVILYLATTDQTVEGARKTARTRADPARGGFEQVGFGAAPLDNADELAAWTVQNSEQLDQHGLLSTLYTSAARFGYNATIIAYERAFGDTPWWRRSPYTDGEHRLVRDPRALLSDRTALPEGPNRAWFADC